MLCGLLQAIAYGGTSGAGNNDAAVLDLNQVHGFQLDAAVE